MVINYARNKEPHLFFQPNEESFLMRQKNTSHMMQCNNYVVHDKKKEESLMTNKNNNSLLFMQNPFAMQSSMASLYGMYQTLYPNFFHAVMTGGITLRKRNDFKKDNNNLFKTKQHLETVEKKPVLLTQCCLNDIKKNDNPDSTTNCNLSLNMSPSYVSDNEEETHMRSYNQNNDRTVSSCSITHPPCEHYSSDTKDVVQKENCMQNKERFVISQLSHVEDQEENNSVFDDKIVFENIKTNGNLCCSVLQKNIKEEFELSSSSQFLFHVKERVNAIRNENKNYSAVQKAEYRFTVGALLSPSSSSSSFSHNENRSTELSSVDSNAATVLGKISPEKAYETLKLKLKNDGLSEGAIAYELSCHLEPSKAKLQQKQRRYNHNLVIIRRRRELLLRKHNTLLKQSSSTHSSFNTSSYKHTSNDGDHEHKATTKKNNQQKINKNDFDFTNMLATTRETPSLFFPIVSSSSQKKKKKWDKTNAIMSEISLYTHDDKVMVYTRQRMITEKLAELQKLRDRGDISLNDFESIKKDILFLEIFDYDCHGNIILRKNNNLFDDETVFVNKLAATNKKHVSEINYLQSYLPKLKRLKQQSCLLQRHQDLDFCDLNYHKQHQHTQLDTMNYYTNELQDLNDMFLDTHVEIYKNDDISLNSTQYDYIACRLRLQHRIQLHMNDIFNLFKYEDQHTLQKKNQNFNRRIMLMRQFDQRAPPEKRMFQQDTTFKKKKKKNYFNYMDSWMFQNH